MSRLPHTLAQATRRSLRLTSSLFAKLSRTHRCAGSPSTSPSSLLFVLPLSSPVRSSTSWSLRPGPPSALPPGAVTNKKTTTRITGLDVVPNAREVLLSLYEETIKKAESYPSNEWNVHVVQLCRYRHGLVSAESEVEAIEAAVRCGQVEELLEQAEDEYDLLVSMNEVIRPWEPDTEGDAVFADYHPSFGQTKKDFDFTLPDEAATWGDVDTALGLRPPSAAAAPADTTETAKKP